MPGINTNLFANVLSAGADPLKAASQGFSEGVNVAQVQQQRTLEADKNQLTEAGMGMEQNARIYQQSEQNFANLIKAREMRRAQEEAERREEEEIRLRNSQIKLHESEVRLRDAQALQIGTKSGNTIGIPKIERDDIMLYDPNPEKTDEEISAEIADLDAKQKSYETDFAPGWKDRKALQDQEEYVRILEGRLAAKSDTRSLGSKVAGRNQTTSLGGKLSQRMTQKNGPSELETLLAEARVKRDELQSKLAGFDGAVGFADDAPDDVKGDYSDTIKRKRLLESWRDARTTSPPEVQALLSTIPESSNAHNVRVDVPASYGKAAVRYNNPAAAYPRERDNLYGIRGYGEIGGGHKIGLFQTPIHGLASNMDLLATEYGGMKLKDAVRKWRGGNGSQAVPDGFDPEERITEEFVRNPDKMLRFFNGMIANETGENFLSKESMVAAHKMFLAGGASARGNDIMAGVIMPRPRHTDPKFTNFPSIERRKELFADIPEELRDFTPESNAKLGRYIEDMSMVLNAYSTDPRVNPEGSEKYAKGKALLTKALEMRSERNKEYSSKITAAQTRVDNANKALGDFLKSADPEKPNYNEGLEFFKGERSAADKYLADLEKDRGALFKPQDVSSVSGNTATTPASDKTIEEAIKARDKAITDWAKMDANVNHTPKAVDALKKVADQAQDRLEKLIADSPRIEIPESDVKGKYDDPVSKHSMSVLFDTKDPEKLVKSVGKITSKRILFKDPRRMLPYMDPDIDKLTAVVQLVYKGLGGTRKDMGLVGSTSDKDFKAMISGASGIFFKFKTRGNGEVEITGIENSAEDTLSRVADMTGYSLPSLRGEVVPVPSEILSDPIAERRKLRDSQKDRLFDTSATTQP